jgi:hypothetical protein
MGDSDWHYCDLCAVTAPAQCPCGKPLDEPAETWPGKAGVDICLDCWEAECSKSWWEMVARMQGAL